MTDAHPLTMPPTETAESQLRCAQTGQTWHMGHGSGITCDEEFTPLETPQRRADRGREKVITPSTSSSHDKRSSCKLDGEGSQHRSLPTNSSLVAFPRRLSDSGAQTTAIPAKPHAPAARGGGGWLEARPSHTRAAGRFRGSAAVRRAARELRLARPLWPATGDSAARGHSLSSVLLCCAGWCP